MIYNYDLRLKTTHMLIKKQLSKENTLFLKKYDEDMARHSLAKTTCLDVYTAFFFL